MAASNPDPAAALEDIRRRIILAARSAGRDPDGISLTAVSKQQPWSVVGPVVAAGQTIFGENRVQEAWERWRERRGGLELRLIGPLQTNKAREAVALFDVIETVDRPRLAEKLAHEIHVAGAAPRLYVQVNTGEEPQKAGVAPQAADAFIQTCRHHLGLTIEGLMCIPPHGEPPGPHFALLRMIAGRNGLNRLSMGMSEDFEIAIGHGATNVRVGSALFGARHVAPGRVTTANTPNISG
jgi:pyridoxal phosphate enzyme (YggS family)